MKKPGPMILVAAALIFVGFLCGFFIGRNVAGSPVTLTNVTEAPHTQATGTSQNASVSTAPVQSDTGKININTATAELLQTLPGIGEVLAKRIVDDRTANGPFTSITDLGRVDGIGAERLASILELITVGG